MWIRNWRPDAINIKHIVCDFCDRKDWLQEVSAKGGRKKWIVCPSPRCIGLLEKDGLADAVGKIDADAKKAAAKKPARSGAKK